MPINPIVLQRRHAELGRIRLGSKGDRGQPQKLERFRFTSPHARHVRDLAELYGGTARPWKNKNRDEWEVHSEAQSIPVIVVRGGVSQWLETWTGGGCAHRCDGVHEVLTDTACNPDDPLHQQAKPTTRLSVMLRDLDAIGVWRLESHGWNAAAELPGMVELAQQVADLVPARLMLSERVSIRDGKTSRFVVPGLDLEIAPSRLAAIVSGQAERAAGPAAVGAGEQRELGAAPTAAVERVNVDARADACTTREELLGLLEELRAAGPDRVDRSWPAVEATLRARSEALATLAQHDRELTQVSGQGAQDVDAVWVQVLTAAGQQQPPLNTVQLEARYSELNGGQMLADANAGQLSTFLGQLQGQGVAA